MDAACREQDEWAAERLSERGEIPAPGGLEKLNERSERWPPDGIARWDAAASRRPITYAAEFFRW